MALACIGTTVYAATDTSSLNPWLADMEYSVRGEVRCFCMSARGIKRMCRSIVLRYIPAKNVHAYTIGCYRGCTL